MRILIIRGLDAKVPTFRDSRPYPSGVVGGMIERNRTKGHRMRMGVLVGDEVIGAKPAVSLRKTVRLMTQTGIGCVTVEVDGALEGILTSVTFSTRSLSPLTWTGTRCPTG